MKKLKINIILLLFITFLSTCKKEESFDLEDWKLTFSDEFNDSILNQAKWGNTPHFPRMDISEEQSYYVKSAVKLNNGILNLEAKRDTIMGLVYDKNQKPIMKKFYFTSGYIHTTYTFSQQYGYFETRAKVPSGIGFWPAFWLYGYALKTREIDIFEIFGSKPNHLRMTNHFWDKSDTRQMNGFTYQGPDFSKEFHVFGMEWNPKEIIWYLDGKKVFSSEKGVSDEMLYIILSMGVGEGSLLANDKTIFPQSFLIDYVRVYKKKN